MSVYVGQRRGHASTSDFSPQALARTVRAAYDIASITGEDPFAGLPDERRLARGENDVSGLALFQPWHISVPQAIELAREIEAANFAVSPQIVNKSLAQEIAAVQQNIYDMVGYEFNVASPAQLANQGKWVAYLLLMAKIITVWI